LYSWVPTVSSTVVAGAQPSRAACSGGHCRRGPRGNGTEGVARAHGVSDLDSGHGRGVQPVPAGAGQGHAVRAPGGAPGADSAEEFLLAPAGALDRQGGVLRVGEQPRGPLDQLAGLPAVEAGQLLGGAGRHGAAEAVGGGGVPQHGRRVVGADQDEAEAACAFGGLGQVCAGASAMAPA
jgi:hypothetical protein